MKFSKNILETYMHLLPIKFFSIFFYCKLIVNWKKQHFALDKS